jgi:signal transduction histidine kinase
MSLWADANSGRNAQVVGDFCLPLPAQRPSARREPRLSDPTRIAQGLHDTLLSGFFATSVQLHAAVDQLPADCAEAKPRFSDVLQLLDRVLDRGRSAVEALRSPGARATSLGEALADVPNDLDSLPAARFRVIVLGKDRELTAGVDAEVYRIGREAIVNAFRHSRADEIETEIEYGPTELRISVRDNGCGIEPRDLERGREHRGLHGMRERAERIGGRLRLLSRVALGTEVELRVPARVAFSPRVAFSRGPVQIAG